MRPSSRLVLIAAVTPLMQSCRHRLAASWVTVAPFRSHAVQNLPFYASESPHMMSKKRRFSSCILAVSADDSEHYSRNELEKLTVKVLKEKLKLIHPPVKTSHLKLKGDLIDCLLLQYTNNNSIIESPPNSTIPDTTLPPTYNTITESPSTRTRLVRMPLILSSSDTASSPQPLMENTLAKKSTSSPKDAIFEQVFKRYPPLRELHSLIQQQQQQSTWTQTESSSNLLSSFIHPAASKSLSGLGDFDIRQTYHPILTHLTSSDMDVVMVGTASCVPGVSRGVSCTALRLQWRRPENLNNKDNHNNMNTPGTWIFDCGESTQLQVQRTGSIRPGKITKIFITHSHGDHSFGLPGLLCLMGQDRDRDAPPIDIYGPQGLRLWLRIAIRYSVSRIVPPYRVHEIMDIPMAPEWLQAKNGGRYYYGGRQAQREQTWGSRGLAGEDPMSWISHSPQVNLEPSNHFGEVVGGRDIPPNYNHPLCVDGAPIYEIEDLGDVKVWAAPMSHGIPCIGYVVEEESKTGKLKSDLVSPTLLKNIEALKQIGIKSPMKIMAQIKDLPEGGTYTFPDGTVIHRDDVVEPPIKGRKIVICGDTADARALTGLAKGADLLIHESTNAFLNGVDKDTSQEEVTNDARIHGHSTPFMAGNFAKAINAKRMLLTHFSSRYKGDQSLESISIMTRIEKQAMQASGLTEDRVAAAWDLMVLPIPRN